jgi:hypothetical protein
VRLGFMYWELTEHCVKAKVQRDTWNYALEIKEQEKYLTET